MISTFRRFSLCKRSSCHISHHHYYNSNYNIYLNISKKNVDLPGLPKTLEIQQPLRTRSLLVANETSSTVQHRRGQKSLRFLCIAVRPQAHIKPKKTLSLKVLLQKRWTRRVTKVRLRNPSAPDGPAGS